MNADIHETTITDKGRTTILRHNWTGKGIYNARLYPPAGRGKPATIYIWRVGYNEHYTPTVFYCPQPLTFQEPIIIDRLISA